MKAGQAEVAQPCFFTCDGQLGLRVPAFSCLCHSCLYPGAPNRLSSQQQQLCFLSRAGFSESTIAQLQLQRTVFLSSLCFLFAGWGILFSGVRFSRF